MNEATSDWLEQAKARLQAHLEASGLRATRERELILKATYELGPHYDADQLHRHLLEKGIKVSRATVYNTLQLLVEVGLVRRYTFGEGRTLYEWSLGRRQHDHLLCMDCGRLIEFCDPQMGSVIEAVGRFFQMRPTHHELVIYAHCEKTDCPRRTA